MTTRPILAQNLLRVPAQLLARCLAAGAVSGDLLAPAGVARPGEAPEAGGGRLWGSANPARRRSLQRHHCPSWTPPRPAQAILELQSPERPQAAHPAHIPVTWGAKGTRAHRPSSPRTRVRTSPCRPKPRGSRAAGSHCSLPGDPGAPQQDSPRSFHPRTLKPSPQRSSSGTDRPTDRPQRTHSPEGGEEASAQRLCSFTPAGKSVGSHRACLLSAGLCGTGRAFLINKMGQPRVQDGAPGDPPAPTHLWVHGAPSGPRTQKPS